MYHVFLKYLQDFLDKVWPCLADPIVGVRENALALFQASVRLLNTRDKTTRMTTFAGLFNKLRSMLQSKNVDFQIAGLLAFEPIILGAADVGAAPRYEDLYQMINPFVVNDATAVPQGVRMLLFPFCPLSPTAQTCF